MVKFECAFAKPVLLIGWIASLQLVTLTYEAAPVRYGSGNPTSQIGAHVTLAGPASHAKLSVDELELRNDKRNL